MQGSPGCTPGWMGARVHGVKPSTSRQGRRMWVMCMCVCVQNILLFKHARSTGTFTARFSAPLACVCRSSRKVSRPSIRSTPSLPMHSATADNSASRYPRPPFLPRRLPLTVLRNGTPFVAEQSKAKKKQRTAAPQQSQSESRHCLRGSLQCEKNSAPVLCQNQTDAYKPESPQHPRVHMHTSI